MTQAPTPIVTHSRYIFTHNPSCATVRGMSNPTSVPGRHTQDPPAADLEDELARIASDVHALAIRHGIDHAGSLTTDTLIRALHSIARNRADDERAAEAAALFRGKARGDVPVVAVFNRRPAETHADRHAREVAAVRASLMLGDETERHNSYPLRPKAA